MKETLINNFNELHEFFGNSRDDKRWIFRGHGNAGWELLPKIGRPPFAGVDERAVFDAWKRAAIEYVSSIPQSEWEWLAIAQHHGLATRLLDWTVNPLNACYFAVRESFPGDAIIYAAKFKHRVQDSPPLPIDYSYLAIYRPQRVVPRITRQGGLFTIHPEPNTPMNESTDGILEIERVVIRENYRDKLLSELSYYGINAATLFPDLDGLSTFMNWTIEKKEYWRYPDIKSPPFG